MKRVRLLSAGRLVSLAVFVSVAASLAGYLFLRQRRIDQEEPRPKLQGQVVAVFNNTRYAHEVQGQVRFILTSGVDRSYSDGTHELEVVKLESFGRNNDRHDVVTADRARVSNPSDLEKLDAEFISNVLVQTNDGLTVRSEYLRYRRENNTIETDKLVEFEGRNFSGRSLGLHLEADTERAELLNDVDVTVQEKPKSEGGLAAGAPAATKERSPEEKAAHKAEKRRKKLARKQARAARLAAIGRRDSKRNKSGGGIADIAASKKPTRIRAQSALIEKKEHRVTLTQNVMITQEEKEARADKMIAYVDASNHLQRVESRGNSYLKEIDRAELRSPDIDLFFGPSRQLVRGVATGGAHSRSLGEGPLRESRADRIEATFAETDQGSVAETVIATGNAQVKFYPATDDSPKNPTERELRSDTITLYFQPDGHFLKSADAVGNSVITVLPVRAEPKADKKTIQAARMNAVFFDEGNKIKTFSGFENVRIEIAALLAGQHEPRITTSARVTADLIQDSQDIDRAVQEGDFKYREGDRNGTADRAVYDGTKEFLQLRGRRPMAWDSKGRTQADEIDYDRQNDETHARGDVRTTYYSRESAGETTPFNNTKSPIFITAERADARNKDGIAIYTINARGWQDDNFVKADRIELYQKDKRMVATGNVESSLYRVKKGTPGNEADAKQPDTQAENGDEDGKPSKSKRHGRKGVPQENEEGPGFAWADRMTYSDADRLVHYDGSVRARHGADYIEGDSVDVFLEKETNEVHRINAVGNVLLVQPGRRGTGDNFNYTADDGRAVLTGKAARVDDKEKGSTMGTQLTFYSRDDKIVVENQQSIGRVRTTHRMAKNR